MIVPIITWLAASAGSPAGSLAFTGGATLASVDHRPFLFLHHGVTVALPNKPERSTRRADTFIGPVETEIFTSVTDEAEYTVSYTRLPTIARAFSTHQSLCERASAQMLEEVGGVLLRSSTQVGPRFDREVAYLISGGGGMGRARFAIVEDTLVVVNAVAADVSALDRFFSGLEAE